MKIALVHELLTMRGGAEKVFKILADMFPDAPIYTLLYDEQKLGDWFPKERIHTSSLQQSFTTNYQLATTHSINHHLYLSRFPRAIEAFDFSEFDLVISSSSAFAHGIITNGKPKHLCYVHSPARYLWDRTHDVTLQAQKSWFGYFKKWYLEHIFYTLRIWDAEASYRPDKLLAASSIVQRRIDLYWRRQSTVLTPPISNFWLEDSMSKVNYQKSIITPYNLKPNTYYLIASSLVRYKRIDLAIEACNTLQKNLLIVGEGPDQKRLQSLAGPTIQFVGYKNDDELKELYNNAEATLFCGDEDFGLVPIESMACGTPVLAYRSGGALETIKEHETGEFFDKPTSESLEEVIKKFDQKIYSKEIARSHAQKFSEDQFRQGILQEIDDLMAENERIASIE